MENLSRVREYTAPGLSSRPPTSMSSLTAFSPSSSSSLSPPPPYTFSAPSRPRQPGVTSPQSPPVIPPLSFENDPMNEAGAASRAGGLRSEVQEPLDQTSQRWLSDSDNSLGSQPIIRHSFRTRQDTHQLPNPVLSASSSSVSSASSDGRPMLLSQLERSPERPDSTTGHLNVGSVSSPSETYHPGQGDAAGLRDALQVLQGDGLTVDRSLQIMDRFRQQREEQEAPVTDTTLGTRGREETTGRNEDISPEARRFGEGIRLQLRAREMIVTRRIRERERERQRDRRTRWLNDNNTPLASASQAGLSPVSGPPTSPGPPSATGPAARNAPRHPYPSWHDVVLNNNASSTSNNNAGESNTEAEMRRMQAFLESVSDSDSDGSDDDSFLDAIAGAYHYPPPATSTTSLSSASTTTSTTATVGRNNDNSRHGGLRRQGRPPVDVRENPTSFSSVADILRSQGAERPTGGSGGASVGERMWRERMLQRMRANPISTSPGTPTNGGGLGGRRFAGGFARRFVHPGDYMVSPTFFFV